jgi:lipid-A-disaccharide synthase-like uncharacterized protein
MAAEDLVGWSATLILVATLGRQAWLQWNDRHSSSVPPLMFGGQCLASVLFIAYSAMVGSAVFVVANSLILLTALAGFVASLRHRSR